jgi:hypothetical protein
MISTRHIELRKNERVRNVGFLTLGLVRPAA